MKKNPPTNVICSDDLKEYRENVRYLADSKSDIPFSNSTSEHAAIIMANLFRVSKYSIKLFTGKMSGEVYDHENIDNELVDFIIRGGVLEVLHEKELEEGTKTKKKIDLLKNIFPQSVYTVKLNSTIRGRDAFPHFAVGDNKMYRFEHEKKERKSVVCFNDEMNANILTKIFEENIT